MGEKWVSPEDIADETRFGPEPEDFGAEGGSSRSGFDSPLIDGLFSTEPNPPLHMVDSPLDLTNGGLPRIFRGLQKWFGFDGGYAIIDLLLGGIEFAIQQRANSGSAGDGGDGAGSADGYEIEVGGDWGE